MDRVLNKLNSVTKDTTNQVKKISDKVNALSELTKGVLGAGAAARHTAEMEAAAAAARKVAANAAANAAAAQQLAAEDKNAATAKAAANAAKSAEAAAKAAKEAEAAANEANQNRKRAALFENTAEEKAAAAANEANQNRKRAALFENTAEEKAAAAANEANQNRKREALFENTAEEKAAAAAAAAANEANQNRKREALFENKNANETNLSKVDTSLFQNTPSVAGRLALENVKENAPQLHLTVPQQTRLRSYAEDLYRVIRANPSAQVFIARTFEEIRRNELTSEQIRRILSNLRAIAREDSHVLTVRNQPLDMVLNAVAENASANRSAIGPPTPTTDQRATLRNMVSRFFNIGMDVVNGLSDMDLFNALLLYHFLSMGPRSSSTASASASASASGLGNRAQELEDRSPQSRASRQLALENRPPAQLALQDRNENRGLRIRTPPNARNLYVSPASTGSLSLSNYDNNYRGNFTNDETPNPTPKASSQLNPGSSKNMVRYVGGRRSRKMKSSRRMSCGCGVKFGGARKTRNRKNKRKSKTSRR